MRPPFEAGLRFDEILVCAELSALLGDDTVKFLYGLEICVDDGLVDMNPKRFSRLELGCIGWQVDDLDTLGHAEPFAGVPAGIVDEKQDDAILAGAGLFGKQRQERREERFGDAVGEIPEGLPAGRCNEGGYIKPVEAVMTERCRPFANRRPDTADHRFEADAVFV